MKNSRFYIVFLLIPIAIPLYGALPIQDTRAIMCEKYEIDHPARHRTDTYYSPAHVVTVHPHHDHYYGATNAHERPYNPIPSTYPAYPIPKRRSIRPEDEAEYCARVLHATRG